MTLADWKKRDDFKRDWLDFMRKDCFPSAMETLKDCARPYLTPTATMESLALRQSYLSGFHDCIRMLEQIPTLANTSTQAQMVREWDWLNSADPTSK